MVITIIIKFDKNRNKYDMHAYKNKSNSDQKWTTPQIVTYDINHSKTSCSFYVLCNTQFWKILLASVKCLYFISWTTRVSRKTIGFPKFSLYKNLLDIQILSESYSNLDSDLDTI